MASKGKTGALIADMDDDVDAAGWGDDDIILDEVNLRSSHLKFLI